MKHKIHFVAEEINENWCLIFLFQSGDIDVERSRGILIYRSENIDLAIYSREFPCLSSSRIININGHRKRDDFTIPSKKILKIELAKYKELEYAYNNR